MSQWEKLLDSPKWLKIGWEVKKYKDWNLTVYRWLMRAMLTKKIHLKKIYPKSDVYGLN
jgi:hypothetical protein